MHKNNPLQNASQRGWPAEKPYLPDRRNPMRRYLIAFLTLLLVAVMFLLVFPSRNLLDRHDAKIAGDLNRLRFDSGLISEIEILKGQLVATITGSIESKIGNLEANIRMGRVSPADLGMIQDLKNDLNILKTYSSPNPSATLADGGVQPAEPKLLADSQKLLREVSRMKTLLYASIASYGLLVVAMGGMWLQNHCRYKQLRRDMRQPLLLERHDKI